MTDRAVWRAGERLTLRHLAEHSTACDLAEDLADRLERANAVAYRQRHEITRLHNLIRTLQEVPQ